MSDVVWITGAGGLIGSYLARNAPPRWQARPITRKDLDLADPAAIGELWKRNSPGLVIHCAALSKAAACEQEPALARQVNVEATRRLSELAAEIPFIFFSTDLVFDGSKGNYSETDAVNPLTVYGKTKAEAEQIVLQNSRHTVVRVALNAGVSPTGDRAFNEEIHNAWKRGETLNLFTDEFRTPIPAAVTARAVWELAGQAGVYHLGGAERLSRWDIGQLLAQRWKDVTPKMKPGSVRDYQGPRRSPDTSMNCAKVQRLLSFPLPRFSEWLRANPHEPV